MVAVDGEQAILNPFSGRTCGHLRVLLALGSHEQIAHLQNARLNQHGGLLPERPLHLLERQDVYSDAPQTRFAVGHLERVVEHLFEVSVTSIQGLRLVEDMIWGEADCFVQYHFPAQSQLTQQGAPDIANGEITFTCTSI